MSKEKIVEAKVLPRVLSPEAELSLIKKKLGHWTEAPTVRYWLDTGSPLLNTVLGSPNKGLPYGKLYEISGYESHGKTALMLELAALAQRDGAATAIWDLESSWDSDWAVKRGLNPQQVYLFKPQIGTFGKEKEQRLITAQESCEEIELWMKRRHAANPSGRIFLGVDAIAAILTEEEAAAGIQDQNMRTMVSLASFLSKLLRRWVAMAVNYNVMLVMVNQLRTAPGVMFGDPTYTPGGNAVRYYSSVRLRMYKKGGKVLKDGKPIGIRGVLSNWKNKAGEGSQEGIKVGFKLLYNGRLKCIPLEEVKKEKE